jgi:hypothetical protein
MALQKKALVIGVGAFLIVAVLCVFTLSSFFKMQKASQDLQNGIPVQP